MDITVIVPIYQHWHMVTALFAGLAEQTLPTDRWEFLLVDNGSDVIPDEKDLPHFVRLLHCPEPGSYAARNTALQHARGELLVFTDADCRPSPDWLSNVWQAYESSNKQSLIAGGIEVARLEAGKQSLVELYDMALGLSQASYTRNGYAVTANLAIPRVVFDRVGPFDKTRFSGGDKEFCLRARAAGYELIYRPNALIYHPARRHWGEIATKAKRIKGGKVCSGTFKSRALHTIRTYLPPVWAFLSVVRNRRFSVRERICILGVLCRLWAVEMIEVTQLLLGKTPERR
jgi:GT2 family glycosyltransferase